MKKGDIVKNTCQNESNLYKYQIVVATFNGGKGIRTIDYLGNSHVFDKAIEHMEVVGHSHEYDAYMKSLKNLIDFGRQVN